MEGFIFNEAFDLTMKFEIGPWYDQNDEACITGNIDTKENKRKCGYVDHPDDPGGETKFGIAANHNKDVDIASLDLSTARNIYYEKYWLKSQCDKLPLLLQPLHFDAVVNHGSRRATKFLQELAGCTVDGSFGPNTLKAVQAIEYEIDSSLELIEIRRQFYHRLVKSKPKLGTFINGWMNRCDALEKFINTKSL